MDHRKTDYQMINDMWHLLKEFGNLTNSPEDSDRWSDFMDKSDDFLRKYPETRSLMREFRFMINDRAIASNQGELRPAC